VHGLKKRKLDMAQILPSIGFRHSDDYVQPLQKPVRARYCKGLFTQVPYRNGSVYNVIASKDKLLAIEEQLMQVINLYKRRLEWLTTESMEDALDWLWKLHKVVPRTTTCTVEAITKAIGDQHVEAVYLFTEGTTSDGSSELLKRKVEGSQVPIHVVSFNCNSPRTISYFKDIVKDTNGRFHAFSVCDEYDDTLASFQRTMDNDGSSTINGRGRGDGMPSLKLGIGVREDVISLWHELDEARNTMAEIQALQIELSDPKSTPISTTQPPKDMRSETTRPKAGSKSELYMSSKEWLKRHGLKNRKLGFYDLLQTLAFKHCDGVVDIQRPPVEHTSDAIVRPKLINARYCDKFAHVRWKDGTIMHVHVSGPVHRNYEQRMLSALDSYKKRIEWLQQGSRELFGTVIEDQVTILIDTSASMASRLFLVKDKLYRLMQEQLRHKVKFNLMKFDTKVQAWRDRLVDCNTHNLDNAWQWVKGLSTGGSTNTLAALKQALTDSQCRGIYLLTDGRPDQPPSSIHAQVNLLDPVPIHAISFNCADSEANEFLCQLSSATGARFHYFSEDGYDINGPKPYESEDLKMLREEIQKGLADLKKIAMLRNECAQLDWYGSNTGRCSKWLKEHGLVARKLTILDALSPTLIPHTTKYVPILDKHILSKVFDQVLPLAHTSGSNRDEVQLVNPQGVNLKAYETKLDAVIKLYTSKLDELVYFGLSDQERIKYPEDRVTSFAANRESMMEDLEQQGWQVRREDVLMLEKEIEQANTFLIQSKELRKASEQAAREIAEEQKRARTEMENKRIEQIMSKSASMTSALTQLTPQGNKYRLRHHKVLARSEVDGFYYPGLVCKCINTRYVEVDFESCERQVVGVRYVIPVEGARPCPSLKVGDYVLVRTLIPREETDDLITDGGCAYVPGIVQVVPLRRSTASKCYTILRFNGKKITSLRKDLVKISKARYTFACRYIRDALISAYKASCPFGLYPKGVDEGKDLIAINMGRYLAYTMSQTSRKRPSLWRSRSPTDHFEDLKKELDQKHATQLNEIREHRERLEQLHQQLAEEQKKQREQQEVLEQKQKDLQDQQDKLVQTQIEEHKEKQNRLQEEQKRLQEQQEELLKKQRDQQEQLLMQQYNQTQSLQLQQQQLMQMLASGQQPKKDQAVETDKDLRSRDDSPVTSPRRTPKSSPRHSSHGSPQRSSVPTPRSSKHNSKRSSPRSSRPSSGKKSNRKPSTSGERVDVSASDTDSPSSSESEASSKSSTTKNGRDDVDGAKEPEHAAEEDGPPDIQFHLSDNNEACLLTKGSHGLLISRLPLDVDPAIETRHVPKQITEGDEVLARWADEGWYYRGTVRQDCGDGTFFIEDSVGDLEQIPRIDIITDEDDADNVIKGGDPVVGLHPSFSYSYAPGVVIGLEDDNMHQVRYYDGIEAMVPREELYMLSTDKFETDCAYILACEESLVGQAVVTRNDDDGTFHLGTVRERVGNGRQYIIEWADQSVQLQSTGYIFGAHTKRHPLSIGDRVLALADPATYVYVPGWITGSNGRRLVVKFCNGKSSSHVDPLQCFWLSRDYYDRVVEFYKKRTKDEQ
ncbi:hypothetical protein QZH41_019678, partial [Actinostola sp. cb2023]